MNLDAPVARGTRAHDDDPKDESSIQLKQSLTETKSLGSADASAIAPPTDVKEDLKAELSNPLKEKVLDEEQAKQLSPAEQLVKIVIAEVSSRTAGRTCDIDAIRVLESRSFIAHRTCRCDAMQSNAI